MAVVPERVVVCASTMYLVVVFLLRVSHDLHGSAEKARRRWKAKLLLTVPIHAARYTAFWVLKTAHYAVVA